MTDAADREKSGKLKKSNWWWPEVVATSLVGAAAVAFRGCWHGKMGWPVAERGYSYQVCLKCGAMRLFDENTFSSHGPFRYDLDQLIAWEQSRKTKPHPVADLQRPAL
ncbi:MAG: hypothetical protein ABSD64_12445 [Terriglobales bacterium]|jgi:hypothetical protein